jgi:hypothetical protein
MRVCVWICVCRFARAVCVCRFAVCMCRYLRVVNINYLACLRLRGCSHTRTRSTLAHTRTHSHTHSLTLTLTHSHALTQTHTLTHLHMQQQTYYIGHHYIKTIFLMYVCVRCGQCCVLRVYVVLCAYGSKQSYLFLSFHEDSWFIATNKW